MDRTFIIILVLFVLIGVVSYDRYLILKGEVSPISGLLDYAGLSRFGPEDATTVTTSKEEYQYSIQQNVLRLRDKHHQIQAQREKLVSRRYEILQQMIGMADQLDEETMRYAELIRNEEQRFMNDVNLVAGIRDEIAEGSSLEEDERAARLMEVRERIEQLSANLDILSEEDARKFGDQLDTLLNAFEGIEISDPAICDSAIEPCPEPDLFALQAEMEALLQESVTRPQSEIDALTGITQTLVGEYNLLSEGLRASDLRFNEIDENLDAQFRDLARDLVSITQEEMEKLLKLYEELQDEQRYLLENMQIGRERLYEAHQTAALSAAEIFKNVPTPTLDTRPLSKSWLNSKTESVKLLNAFEKNESELSGLVKDQWIKDQEFFKESVSSLNGNMRKLIEDRQATERQFEYSLESKMDAGRKNLEIMRQKEDMMRDRVDQAPSSGSSSADRLQQRQKIDDVMRQMRDRARDQNYMK